MDPGVRERFLAWLNERLGQPDTPAVVLVTHHIEEIVPGFENTLILSARPRPFDRPDGKVVTRETIEAVYGTRLARIETSGGRLWPLWGYVAAAEPSAPTRRDRPIASRAPFSV